MNKNTVMMPDICEQAAKLREAGCSYGFIAKRLGVTEGSISHYCLKEGIESPNTEGKVLPQTAPGPAVVMRGGHKLRHFTPDEDRQIQEMSDAGMNPTAIGKVLDRRHNSITGRMMTLARQQERAAVASEEKLSHDPDIEAIKGAAQFLDAAPVPQTGRVIKVQQSTIDALRNEK